jgi:hypothetical protein
VSFAIAFAEVPLEDQHAVADYEEPTVRGGLLDELEGLVEPFRIDAAGGASLS